MMVELGVRLHFAAGSDKNIKLTTPDDLEMFKAVSYTHLDVYKRQEELAMIVFCQFYSHMLAIGW